ncbi:MAG TPA: p-hydroxycinnamoyl CoA hydratase/lyase [Candidatus Binatia bacterium]
MGFTRIVVSHDGPIATIRLNRPEKKNAMDPAMHRDMGAALAELKIDDSARVLVLTGSGDSFCAGQDLKAFFAENFDDPVKARRVTAEAMDWAEVLRTFPKPTIAAVNGWCIGGGLRVMGLCDIAIASDRAQFALSEVNFGNFPAGGSMKMAMELLSHRDVLYMALTGESIDAATAERIRLINRAVAHERLMQDVYALAGELAEKNPVAMMVAKEVFWRDKQMSYSAAVEWELAKQAELSYLQKGEWVRQGIQKFVDGDYKPAFASYAASGTSAAAAKKSRRGSARAKSSHATKVNGRGSK